MDERSTAMKAKANKHRKEQAQARRPAAEAQTRAQAGSQQQGSGPSSRQGGQAGSGGNAAQAGRMGAPEEAETQQSAQREGMGSHRHTRPNEQALDASADVDSLGTHERGAAISREDNEGS
jgi:hypothetical protein